MSNPWDIPPFPEHGDDSADTTHKMVGRSLTEWEELEYCLAHLYAQMIGQPAKIAALRYYGEGRIDEKSPERGIFSQRLKALVTIADKLFVELCDQAIEGEFSRIAMVAERLADRRNEIAHGVVRPLQWVQQMLPEYEHLRGQRAEYALIPPLYTSKKLDDKHRPKYIYTANELMQFAQAFCDLSQEVVRLRLRIARIRPS